ncbi:MAG TPA: hypothetical protein VFW94_12040 [Candidatus Acidoferrales bacterium]|nr:hypothetical protein [Candidatus Acidoferrales bacterium]
MERQDEQCLARPERLQQVAAPLAPQVAPAAYQVRRDESELSVSERWLAPVQPDEWRSEPPVEPEARLGGSEQFANRWALSPRSQHWAAQRGEQQKARPELEVVSGQSPAPQQSAAEQRRALRVLERA